MAQLVESAAHSLGGDYAAYTTIVAFGVLKEEANSDTGFHSNFQGGGSNQVWHFMGYACGARECGPFPVLSAEVAAYWREKIYQERFWGWMDRRKYDETADYELSLRAGKFAKFTIYNHDYREIGQWVRDNICDSRHRGELYWCEE